MMLPDFFIIGAMKSGTTTLHEYLDLHPDIFMCPNKEPMFFSREEKYALGINWYKSLFSDARPGQLIGESSTCYSRWPKYSNVPKRIHQSVPDAKFIYIMRNPIRRAYSHYVHNMQIDNRKYISFGHAIYENPQIVETSRYMKQIQQYLPYFDKTRFLFIKFENFIRDPGEELTRVQKFLGISVLNLAALEKIEANKAGEKYVRATIRDRLYQIRHRTPIRQIVNCVIPEKYRHDLMTRIIDSLSKSFVGKKRLSRITSRITPFSEIDESALLNLFIKDIESLEDFTGLDLSDWKQIKTTPDIN